MITTEQIHEAVRVLNSMGYAVTKDGRLYSLPDDEDEVPEVEVTIEGVAYPGSLERVEAQETPVIARRSGARNQSSPHLQSAFMDEARASMGQPGAYAAMELLDKRVRLVFNVDKPPVEGVLTSVINHPSNAPAYLVLDNNSHLMYPLNSVQSIEALE